ncbi:filament-like plant protein 6 [Impatiens glandulifera]|uniref:filament-like plant protein 6 n=1 Tax=Impatiens glandulifera TaxID=253017 RepID=UPI001FB13806|nr:filament-like plant protein 6 [Impatiens glandulifera]
MDHKTWAWRKRSSEKTIIANENTDLSLRTDNEETIPREKEASLEQTVKDLHLKLASLLLENQAKDENIAKHSRIAKEAISGRVKAEAEAEILKQELEKAIKQEEASNGRLTQLNFALKDSMQQLNLIRGGQERVIHDAVMKTSAEFEKAQKRLEEKLSEQNKKLSSLTVENNHLVKVLIMKETVIEDLAKRNFQAEDDFARLMAKMDALEKEKAFLVYELRMLEKELELNRQSTDKSHKLYMEGVKKISKLESECQRLRILMRKRLPGPATLAKMKNEVEILRKKSNLGNNNPSTPEMNLLMEQLHEMEEENNILRKNLARKDDLRTVQDNLELVKYCHHDASKDLSPKSSFGFGSDESNSSESWALALIGELENFRNDKSCRRMSDLNLMDDFVEMEKLALVSVEPTGNDDRREESITGYITWKSEDKYEKELQTKLRNSIHKIVELLRVIGQTSSTPLGEDNIVRAFQWKGDLEIFTNELASAMEWIVGNCIPFKDQYKNLESLHQDLDSMLKLASDMNEDLMKRLRESNETVGNLQRELKETKECKGMIEDQIENQKMINEELDTQLSITKVKLNDVLQKLVSLEVEYEDKTHCCEDLEATCLELQLQLESIDRKPYHKDSPGRDEKLGKTGWEITAASAKLVECQQTILNLGKQLKALNSAKITNMDKAMTIVRSKKLVNRPSLRDRMLAEDDFNKPQDLAIISGTEKSKPFLCIMPPLPAAKLSMAIIPSKKRGGDQGGGGGFLRKLLMIRNKGSGRSKA